MKKLSFICFFQHISRFLLAIILCRNKTKNQDINKYLYIYIDIYIDITIRKRIIVTICYSRGTNMLNKIYSRAEMRELGIDTSDYVFIDKAGDVKGTLLLKADARNKMIRLFFHLDDGRKIITPVFWWQIEKKVGNIDVGSRVLLHYKQNGTGGIHLEAAEIIEAAKTIEDDDFSDLFDSFSNK